ncbi:hypothetical protein FQA47_001961 [Oryzias melastigma]|uniref:C2H2-type domain-containing protein n=1 Tax=Oryzias melastigma TaxID=30732 RepID=A0A834FA53_ORYME|nr:hypothetical protein FQA47_001961 [Oryzias melastigma]
MDATLRKAAFEIMSIFENTLTDHKRELSEKEEMVAQLKLKLQVAELRLKDLQAEGPSTAAANETQAILEIVPDVPNEVPVEKEIVPAPEIDFEVPDDWCAPLGTEVLAKQDEAFCPSVRLREFSIPLCHVPMVKKESVNNFGSPQTTSDDSRKSRKLADASEIPKPAQKGGPRGKGSRMQNELRLLFKQLNQEDFIDISSSGLRKSTRLEKGERKKRPFQCTKCPKRFRRAQTLEKHKQRKHKIKGKPEDAKEDLGWTQPLEDHG